MSDLAEAGQNGVKDEDGIDVSGCHDRLRIGNLFGMTLETVLTDAMSLSPRERSLLADELWRSVPADEQSVALTRAQREDLQRRLAEDTAGQSDPQPWEQARAVLRRSR